LREISLDAYQEEIKARIDFTNAKFAKMLPRTATWCKTPKVKPNPRASTNPAPGCLSFQKRAFQQKRKQRSMKQR